jgi:thioredoxin-like negative regulator of GroEL
LESDTSSHNDYPQVEAISADEFLRITGDPAHEPFLIDWEAKWCRKCMFLKPKLAGLKEAFPKLRFFSVDVQKAPMSVLQGAGIKKMPTVQVWKQGQSVSEVIGGDVEKIRNMVHETTSVH